MALAPPGKVRRNVPRTLLRASATLLAPCLLAEPGLASAETPILRLFREWDDLQAHSRSCDESGRLRRAEPDLLALEDAVMAEPSPAR
jgi:hypothetical protein